MLGIGGYRNVKRTSTLAHSNGDSDASINRDLYGTRTQRAVLLKRVSGRLGGPRKCGHKARSSVTIRACKMAVGAVQTKLHCRIVVIAYNTKTFVRAAYKGLCFEWLASAGHQCNAPERSGQFTIAIHQTTVGRF